MYRFTSVSGLKWMGGVIRKYNQNASAYAKIINTTMIKNENIWLATKIIIEKYLSKK